MDAWLEIVREDGTLERQRLEGERITVGRSPSAGIPIPDARDLDPEHLLLAPRGEGCWVAVAQGATTPVVVGGNRFEHGMLAWNTELTVGKLKLRLADTLPKEKKTGEKAVSSPVLIAFSVIIPVVGWLLLSEPDTGIDATPTAPPPQQLVEPTVPCPPNTPNVRHRADQDAEAAIAKAERYPFSSQDGVEAVRLYRRSRSCYQAVGAATEAQQMQREGNAMAARIHEDYLTHRLRLQRALEQARLADALIETRALIALVEHMENDPYLAWLRQLARQLELAIDSAAAESA